MTDLTPEQTELVARAEAYAYKHAGVGGQIVVDLLAALDAERARNRELQAWAQSVADASTDAANAADAAEARNRNLEAVAEAARYIRAVPNEPAFDALIAALAVLEEPKGKQDPFGGQATSAAPPITAAEPHVGEAVGQGRPGLAADRNADAPASTDLEEPPA